MKTDAHIKADVKADIPGLHMVGNVVRIDAGVKREKETRGNGDKVLRSERYWGNISRTFSLAQDVDDDKVQARYADGVLSLELPKKASAASKK
ncbi:Hsp20/alpha crystallin family protein [Polaromonas sp.]|nr:Hsp20/alpha crystallin family protein [Polaromonas sp.]MDI1339389.1 Hsp20/alpha crystallin family protein [Polaromonas sp.]